MADQKPTTEFQNWGSPGSDPRPDAVGPHDAAAGAKKKASIDPGKDYPHPDGGSGSATGPGKGPGGPVNIPVKR